MSFANINCNILKDIINEAKEENILDKFDTLKEKSGASNELKHEVSKC